MLFHEHRHHLFRGSRTGIEDKIGSDNRHTTQPTALTTLSPTRFRLFDHLRFLRRDHAHPIPIYLHPYDASFSCRIKNRLLPVELSKITANFSVIDQIRRNSFLSVEDARKQINEYICYYNHKRMHSAIFYVTPFDKLTGKDTEIIKTREEKLAKAREMRVNYNIKSTLTKHTVLSDSR